jgi:ATP-dependent DNA helicase Rep
MKLKSDFPSLKVIKLEQNYRSTGRILKAANAVIANNEHVFEKALWSDLGFGDEIRVLQTRNEDAECERIAAEILDHKLKNRTEFRDYAVLYRGNHQSRLLDMKLQTYQIPYHLSGGTSFFAKNEIKDAMAYLRLLINPNDDAAFLRIVNVPRREIGPSTLEKLGEYATERNISLTAAVDELGIEQRLSSKATDKLRRFRGWLADTLRKCSQDDAVTELKRLFVDIEYEDWLHQTSNSPKQAERRMANVWYLIDNVKTMLDRDKGTADEIGLEEAVSKLLLRDMLEQQEEEDDSDKVHLLTLHASKGLEFPHVFIMGLEEEILPHRSSIEEGNVAEERRLMYVGITRARKTLTLTYAAQRKQYGEKIETIPSRFLDEIPEEDLHWQGRGKSDPEANKAKGAATLASLRSLMSQSQ